MQRYVRGLMLAAAVLVAAGCEDDPLGDNAGGVNNLIASPSVMFLDAGDGDPVLVEAFDATGAAQATSFSLSNVSPEISVALDEGFNPIYNSDGELVLPTSPTRVRFTVATSATPGDFGFDVSAGGQTIRVPVRVLPIQLTGALSATDVSCNDGISYTATAPVGFAPTAAVATDLGSAVNVSVSVDGQTVTFFPEPGSSGTFDVAGTTVAFVPGLVNTNALTTVETIGSVAADCDLGTAPADPGTAPLFTNGFLDSYDTPGGGDAIGGGGDTKFYKITVTADASYDLHLSWGNDADLDFYVIDPTFSEFLSTAGATGDNPELVADLHLAPGEYYIAVVNFLDGTPPDYFKFDFVEHVAEE